MQEKDITIYADDAALEALVTAKLSEEIKDKIVVVGPGEVPKSLLELMQEQIFATERTLQQIQAFVQEHKPAPPPLVNLDDEHKKKKPCTYHEYTRREKKDLNAAGTCYTFAWRCRHCEHPL